MSETGRGCHGHELLRTLLEVAGWYDHLDLGRVTDFETVCRRVQLPEETEVDGGKAACEAAKHLLGSRRRVPLLGLSLPSHVSTQPSQQVSNVKKMREHAEEKKLARGRPQNPMGGGKGVDGGWVFLFDR